MHELQQATGTSNYVSSKTPLVEADVCIRYGRSDFSRDAAAAVSIQTVCIPVIHILWRGSLKQQQEAQMAGAEYLASIFGTEKDK